MADYNDILHLTETQERHQQRLDRLDFLAEQQILANQRHEGMIQRLDEANKRQEEANKRQDVTNKELKESNAQQKISLAKTDEILHTFGQVQLRMLDQMEKLTNEQVRSNRVMEGFAQRLDAHVERQDKFAQRLDDHIQRQDEFNIIFLDEIREIKRDVRELKDIVINQHDARLRTLEDFMNGFLRKEE